jgi:hypothetical protein
MKMEASVPSYRARHESVGTGQCLDMTKEVTGEKRVPYALSVMNSSCMSYWTLCFIWQHWTETLESQPTVVQPSLPLGTGYSPRRDDKLPHVKEVALSILVFTIVRGSSRLSGRFKTRRTIVTGFC